MVPRHPPSRPDDEQAIRALVGRLVAAIRAKDIDLVMAAFAEDVVSFDLGPPLQHGGGVAFRRRWGEMFQALPGRVDYDVHELRVEVDGDLAFSRSLNRMAGIDRMGTPIDRWLRWTACYRHAAGRWRIVHEHVSVPVDVQHARAVLDSRP